jgi:phosphatidylglycerol:prolipoprotein diacylglycerol transferase
MRVNGHWLHDLDPYLVHFPSSWPVRGIFWYGLTYVIAFFAAAMLAHSYAARGRLPFPRQHIDNWLGALCFGVVIGGRLGYLVLYDRATLVHRPWEIVCLWHGGMASHGGFVGVAIALFLLSRSRNIPLLPMLDFSASVAPLGICLGRIGNFINGEVYGRPTTLPWGVIFPRSAPFPDFPTALLTPRHPSQLYEAFLEGLLLFALIQWRQWKMRRSAMPGQLSGEFLIAYALLRVLCECFREPDAPLILCLTAGQFYSIVLCVAGVVLLGRRGERSTG